jgi:signal transduction histidine kinase
MGSLPGFSTVVGPRRAVVLVPVVARRVAGVAASLSQLIMASTAASSPTLCTPVCERGARSRCSAEPVGRPRRRSERTPRIERDLHDGAQQRLVMLSIDLGLASERIDTDPAAANS